MTVVTSPETSRNSYATVAEADAYHANRLHVSTWTAASIASKEAALIWASDVLDNTFDWDGAKTYGTDQAMRWPRSGPLDRDGEDYDDDTIPQPLINATSELARLLIAEDRSADPGTQGFKSISVGPIRLEIDKHDQLSMIPYSVEMLINHIGQRINTKNSGISVVDLARA